MDPPTPFSELQSSISSALVATTRASNRLTAEDLAFHRSLDRRISERLDEQNERLLNLAQRLLGSAATGSEVVGPTFPDGKDDLEHKWKSVVDVLDSMLEKADISLDEFTGAVKKVENAAPAQGPVPRQAKPKNSKQFRLMDMIKPQLSFEVPPKNFPSGPWKPLLTTKPHAVKSLTDSLVLSKNELGFKQYKHPYEQEIVQYSYPSFVREKADPIPYHDYDSTTAILVDTPEALEEMLSELKTAREIAIDIEHHEHRTFHGLLSLMQISTRDKDWIVDTLKPWRRKLECLNEVFTDPSILKVLHGAYMDIVWLQRDLGLYIVGLFDTHWAARALGYPGGSLAFLLSKFINFEAQKQYQLADWRIRPLPQELFDYARSDTHFLLYIYDKMRNELIDRSDFTDPEKDKIQRVLEKSKETALQRFDAPEYNTEGKGPAGWLRMLMKSPANYTKEQFSVFRAVHEWRDKVAREEDEGPFFLLANHALFNIARDMPNTVPQLLSLSAPVTSAVRSRADELLGVIGKAKEAGSDGPDLIDVLNKHSTHAGQVRVGLEPIITIPNTEVTLKATPPLAVNNEPVRSKWSNFWGSSLFSSFWPQKQTHSTLTKTPDISLAIPLPPLTAEVFADPSHITQTPAKPQPEHKFIKKEDRPQEDDDEVFVIKQLGGLRKRKQDQRDDDPDEELEDLNADEQVLDPIAAQKAAEKAERKAERKAAKRLKKQQDRAAQSGQLPLPEGDTAGLAEQVPFDYANAPSVLHAQREEGKKERKKKVEDKGFDPFKKAIDAPRGQRRLRKPEEGRSKTFK